MKASIRNTELYFDIAGMQLAPLKKNEFIERPTLFMLHGGPGGDHLRYKQHSLELQECAQLVFIDHRGSGRSKKTDAKDYTLENNIEDIEALRQHLGLSRIAVLGTSYGGIVAQGYALRYPKAVTKLILVATAPSFRFLTEAKKVLHAKGTRQQIKAAEALFTGTFKSPKAVQAFFKIMDTLYSTTAKKNGKSVFGKTQTVWSHEALNLGFTTFLREFDFIPQLKKIKCPTLILAGNEDWICPANQSRIMADRIPNSTLHVFKNCSHAVSTDAHNKYIRAIKNFLK